MIDEPGTTCASRHLVRLLPGLVVLALLAVPVPVLALTAKDYPNSGYCSNGKQTTDLKKCKSKASRQVTPARKKRRVR
jgi:hypothetical protein